MSKVLKYFVSLLAAIFVLTSCSDDKHDDVLQPRPSERTLLIYMVATNTLAKNAKDDLKEILTGISELPESSDVLVYYASLDIDKDGPILYRVEHNGTLSELKHYDINISSLSPSRISGVIGDMLKCSPSESYGLVLWSHATGWIPSSSPINPVAFGSDYRQHLDIDRLAEAIPSEVFDFIWCDCCYMSAIEVVYQLRDKCRWFVASPTPLMACGMPYDLTLQYLNANLENLKEAAKISYASIMTASGQKGYSIAITDMHQIEEVAQAAKGIFSSWCPVSSAGLQSYSPDNIGPFYDFLQYSQRVATAAGISGNAAPLEDALSKAIVFKLSSPDFMGLEIDSSLFSGLSVHLYLDRVNDAENFYRSLDWYNAVFSNN